MTDQKALAQIGVVGLAVMGSNIARNFARHDYTVAVYNRSTEKTDAFMAEYGKDGNFHPVHNNQRVCCVLGTPPTLR